MFNHRHYVPIIRWKAGERIALRELYNDDKANLTPLIEITPDTVDNALNRMSMGQFAHRLRIEILEFWGRRSAFLDLSHLTARIAPNQRSEFIQQFHGQASTLGLVLVHVDGLGRTSVSRVRSGLTGIGNDVCLRLFREDLEFEGLIHDINAWIASHETDPAKVHLILDLRSLDSIDQSYLRVYSNIPLLDEWNTVTVVGGSFPKDLSELSVGEHLLPRIEWHYWKQLVSARLLRIPNFGDYATLHPYLQPAFPGMNVSASIRYTTDEHWVVMRGEGLLNEGGTGHAQYPANAQMLMERPEFCGRDFSFGDNYIYERPWNRDKPGIPMNWVTAGVNHHLTFVVRQIADLFELPTRKKPYRTLEMNLPFVAEASEPQHQRFRRRPKASPKKH